MADRQPRIVGQTWSDRTMTCGYCHGTERRGPTEPLPDFMERALKAHEGCEPPRIRREEFRQPGQDGG